jgi:hypothetical protein
MTRNSDGLSAQQIARYIQVWGVLSREGIRLPETDRIWTALERRSEDVVVSYYAE